MRIALAVFTALLAWGCPRPVSENAESQPETKAAPQGDIHRFLNVFDGVVITDRSGESQLSASALNAIDGMSASFWSSPPGNPEQDLTLALPARTRIRRVGLSTGVVPQSGGQAVKRLAIETSTDGHNFTPLRTISVKKAEDFQLFDTEPTETTAIRVRVLGSLNNAPTFDLAEVLIEGDELEPPRRGSLSGTWQLNNHSATFREDGNRISGSVAMDPPMHLQGTWDGRVARLAWVRQKQYGVAILAVNPAGSHLSGFWWFREAIPSYLGTPWFGTKSSSGSSAGDGSAVSNTWLANWKTYPLYAIRFDEGNQLVAGVEDLKVLIDRNPRKRFRLLVRELRGRDAQSDQSRSESRAASLAAAMKNSGIDMSRVQVAAIGRQAARDTTGFPLYAFMHSRVDVEVIE